MADEIFTVAQTAQYLQVCEKTVRRLISSNKFLLNSLLCLTFQLTSLFMRTEGQGQALVESTLMYF